MDEIGMFTALRPRPEPLDVSGARDRLASAIAGTPVQRRAPRGTLFAAAGGLVAARARLAWTLGLSVAVAAALVAGVMVAVQPSSPAVLTAQLLADRASAAALAQPAVSPGQWVYRVLDWKAPVFRKAGSTVHTQAGWETADGLVTYGNAGTLGAGGDLPSYSQLESLPSSPAALDAYLERTQGKTYPALDPQAMSVFVTIRGMLENYVVPPALQAEMYQALALLPGVAVDSHVTAIDGRVGVAFVMPHDSRGSVSEIILNPSTYAFMADAMFGDHGTLNIEEAVVEQVIVGAPGSTQPDLTPPGPAELLAEQAARGVESIPDDSTNALALLPSQAYGATWVLRQLRTATGSQTVWATGDDSQQASYVDGTLAVCARTAACAASTRWLMPAGPGYSIVMPQDAPSKLPSSIPQLLATLNSYSTGCADVAGDCNAVNAIVNMAFGYVTQIGGSWFLLLASIPGVTVAHLTDVTGQADIALRFPFRDGVTEILFKASDYALVGYVRDGVQTVLTKAIAVTGPGSLKQRCESYQVPVPGC